MKNQFEFRVIFFFTAQLLVHETLCWPFPTQRFRQNHSGHFQTHRGVCKMLVKMLVPFASDQEGWGLPHYCRTFYYAHLLSRALELAISAWWLASEQTEVLQWPSLLGSWGVADISSVSPQSWHLEEQITNPLYPTSAASPGNLMARGSGLHSWR